jgi:hypothetical protein
MQWALRVNKGIKMVYTQIEDNKAKHFPVSLEHLVSKGIIDSVDATQEQLAAANVVPVTKCLDQKPNDGYLYEIQILQQVDGSWAEEIVKIEISDEQYQANIANCAQNVRADRDRMLASCDWTQLADASAPNKEAWATFRQALRDVPLQEGFPFNVQWPRI